MIDEMTGAGTIPDGVTGIILIFAVAFTFFATKVMEKRTARRNGRVLGDFPKDSIASMLQEEATSHTRITEALATMTDLLVTIGYRLDRNDIILADVSEMIGTHHVTVRMPNVDAIAAAGGNEASAREAIKEWSAVKERTEKRLKVLDEDFRRRLDRMEAGRGRR